jgi:hypothetical protein
MQTGGLVVHRQFHFSIQYNLRFILLANYPAANIKIIQIFGGKFELEDVQLKAWYVVSHQQQIDKLASILELCY